MKRNIWLLIFLLIMMVCFYAACEDTSYEIYREGSFDIAYSLKKNDAIVGTYYWNGDVNDMDIIIPNTYKGAPVTSLGGLVISSRGVKFAIENENYVAQDNKYSNYISYFSNSAQQVDDEIAHFLLQKEISNFTVSEFVFNLKIGSNIKTIDDNWFELYYIRYYVYTLTDNTDVELYSFFVSVDPANEFFYSDDLGRLYSKENNQLVTAFIYHNRDSFPKGSLPTE